MAYTHTSMLNSIYIEPDIITNAAEYIGRSNLHANKQIALYLLEDDTLLYVSDLNKKIDKKTVKVKNEIFQPAHGLLISMIAAALAPVTARFYTESFNTLSRDDIAKVQLMLLFSEIGYGARHPYELAAKEYRHYCQSKKIYASQAELEADALCLKSLETTNPSTPKLMLMQFVKKDLNSALDNQKEDEGKYFNYITSMLQALGFRQSTDFDRKIFDFSQNPEIDVLLAYQALDAIPVEDFTVKSEPEQNMSDIELADAEFVTDFNPAAAAFYAKQGVRK